MIDSGTPGPATDVHGRPVQDPTANVLENLQTAVRRLDDLRDALNSKVSDALEHSKEVAALRAEYDEKLRDAETKRIDAIRAVDQGNVTRASEVAAAQATALASQLQVSAEALRAQVEATRITTADTLAAALQPIQNDVAVLREVQFRQQGEKTANVETTQNERATFAQKVALASVIIAGISLPATVAIIVFR